jgi:hypothetical protein
VDALHRGDHAELAEARDVGGVEVLRVLDAPAQVLAVRRRPRTPLEDVERLAVGAVADGVHAELVAVLEASFGGRSMSSTGVVLSPVLSSAGRRRARAARRRAAPSAPSIERLMARTVRKPLPWSTIRYGQVGGQRSLFPRGP